MRQQVTLGKRALQLVLCATVASAALTAQTAYASVVVVDFSSNAFSTVPYNIDGFYLNVVTGATGTASFAGYDINPYFSGAGTASALFRFLTPTTGGVVASGTVATPLALGATIGAASTFSSGVVNANSATSGINYFGFRFVNESTGATNYGYLNRAADSQPADRRLGEGAGLLVREHGPGHHRGWPPRCPSPRPR